MIVSVHIHKNGGMKFKNFLMKSYGQKLLLEYGKDNEILKRFFSGGNNPEPNIQNYENYDIVHGHFLANRFDSFPNIELITFLREPAQRVISNYYFFKRNFYAHSPICHMIKEGLSLEEYIDLDSSKNVQSFFFANKSIQDFKFIGILEEYETSIFLMKKELDIKFSLQNQAYFYKEFLKYIKSNRKEGVMTFDKFNTNTNNDKDGSQYEISSELEEHIKMNNQLDYKLYEEAKKCFDNLKEKYNV